ncbi:MAG: hypothetical protein KZQ76_13985, partial [Candidatus Thiodiazotropha sp. (ex Epidulcina cf. delphinae)]|nr:hypothetical protein [Candidatus Thiodiazotropha sp. (ex Epidulcina cf. delphinae)]
MVLIPPVIQRPPGSDTATLLLRFNGRISKDSLLSVEQFAIGDPKSVRAFPIPEYLMDEGFFVSTEFIFDAPWFADQPAYGG